MFQITPQGALTIIIGLWLVYMAIQGLLKLYAYIYQTAYTLGRTTMEAEDTNTLIKAIADLKEDYPGSEEVLVALYAKLTGQGVKKKKQDEKGPIGFGPSTASK